MMLKNLTDLASNAKLEGMSSLIKNQFPGGKDMKNAMSNIMVRILINQYLYCILQAKLLSNIFVHWILYIFCYLNESILSEFKFCYYFN